MLVEGRWNAAKYFDLFMSLPSLFGVLLGRGSDVVVGGAKVAEIDRAASIPFIVYQLPYFGWRA